MKLPLFQLWQAVRSSYWFLPSVMAVGAMGLGAFMVWLDSGPAAGLLEPIGWYQQSKPEGARAVLSAIAGSMITVAGVVFSITIVAISYAANQYGPRILTNFMSDRGNQVTLGTFIATFVYSVVVLRTIQGGDGSYVPQLAVFGAMLLALGGVAVLIYFIHHVPQSIHVNHVVAHIGRQLIRSIDKAFPACFGDSPEQDGDDRRRLDHLSEQRFGDGSAVAAIASRSAGYLQVIDDDRLLDAARKHDLTLCLARSPGDFLYSGMPFALAWPADRVSEAAEEDLRQTYTVGSRRTPVQDLSFLVDELVDIAARALSTGINDPYTATTCVDWLTAGMAELARRQPPSPYRLDGRGDLRVVVPNGSFADLVDRGFGRVRPYLARDINATTHTLAMLGSLAGRCRSREQLQVLVEQVKSLAELARPQHEGSLRDRLESETADSLKSFAEALDACGGKHADRQPDDRVSEPA